MYEYTCHREKRNQQLEMAHTATFFHDHFGVSFSINKFSNSQLMEIPIQTILVFLAGIIALGYLSKKYVFTTNKKNKDCSNDCNCH